MPDGKRKRRHSPNPRKKTMVRPLPGLTFRAEVRTVPHGDHVRSQHFSRFWMISR